MSPFLLTTEERLADWAAMRRSLSGKSDHDQLLAVAAYFAQAPLVKIAYDPDDPSAWPTPWEMIHHNEWDRDILAVMMEATLRLAGWNPDRLCVTRLDDRTNLRSVVGVDQTHALNYDWGMVTTLPTTGCHIRHRWRFSGRHYVEF
jgi:hypothetical protein